MRVLIDGVPVPDDRAAISVFDWGLQRGYGAFEVIRSYGGVAFRADAHLDRLAASAAALGMTLPPVDDLSAWVAGQAAEGGDCLIRVIATSGSRDPLFRSPPRVIVIIEPVPAVPPGYRVVPLAAPWAAGGVASELTGAKTLSYAPNIRATEEAMEAGFHDALLLSRDGHVLEGPTFSVAWFREGHMETSAMDLGILGSITRVAAIEAAGRLGMDVVEGRFPLERLLGADEVVALSTVKEVLAIVAVGDVVFPAGAQGERLAKEFHEVVAAETGT